MSWEQQCEELVASATGPESLFSNAVLAVLELGFEQCMYQLQSRWPVAQPLSYGLDSLGGTLLLLDEQLRQAYLQPLTPALSNSTIVTVWSGPGRPMQSARRVLEAQGFESGWTAMMYRRNGVHGSFSAFRSDGISQREESARYRDWQVLAEAVDHGMRRYVEDSLLPKQQFETLTDMECAVLRCAANGKTATITASILGISERNVKHYREQAIDKLEADNITEAACKALAHGLLAAPREIK